jgi:hypothetical protein
MNKLALIAASELLAASAAPATAAPIQVAQDQTPCINNNQAPLAYLQANHATAMRVTVSSSRIGSALQCIHDTYAAGYKIYLTLEGPTADPEPTADFFAKWVPIYQQAAPLWAISIENEPDLNWHTYSYGYLTPPQYRAIWDAVEPILARDAPAAIRVFGDVSPWGEYLIEQAWGDSRPAGVGAIGFHAYDTPKNGLQEVPELAAWAAARGAPLWLSEQTPAMDPPESVSYVLTHSPNVQLYNTYDWPGVLDNFPGWYDPIAPPLSKAADRVAPQKVAAQKAAIEQATRPKTKRSKRLVRDRFISCQSLSPKHRHARRQHRS